MPLCSIDDISHELKDQSSIDLICASLLIVLFFEVVSVSTSPAGDGDGHGSEWLKDFIDWLDHWYAKLEIPPCPLPIFLGCQSAIRRWGLHSVTAFALMVFPNMPNIATTKSWSACGAWDPSPAGAEMTPLSW